MTRSPTGIIVGAGIAGLSAAIALRHAGYDVQVIDRAGALLSAPGAVVLWPNAVVALDRLGLLDAVTRRASRICTTAVETRSGERIVGPHQVGRDAAEARAYIVRHSDLHAALLDAATGIPIELGRAVARIDQSRAEAMVKTKDGRITSADLAIAADGIWSDTATAIIGTVATHRGYGGVLAISDPADGTPHRAVREYWGDGERFGLFDIGGDRSYWFYLRNEAAPDAAGILTYEQILARTVDWPGALRDVIGATSPTRLTPFSVYARPAPRLLGIGRILCVGDAAHAMEPNLGQGTCQALEDAVALGAAAAGPTADIVHRFEAMRLARIRAIVKRSAEVGMGAHARSPLARHLVRFGNRLVPTRVEAHMASRLHRMPRY